MVYTYKYGFITPSIAFRSNDLIPGAVFRKYLSTGREMNSQRTRTKSSQTLDLSERVFNLTKQIETVPLEYL